MSIGTVTQRVTDFVRRAVPHMRVRLTGSEADLGVHLRSNVSLFESLVELLQNRIKGRERLPIPSDPVDCKASMAMDAELRWVISKLEYIHNSPVNQEADDSEQPA